MIREYLEEILDGVKCNDVRGYPTSIRGAIALVDSNSDKIIGVADLVDVKAISKDEYVAWHKSGRFRDMGFFAEDKPYYSYQLQNVRRVAKPIKLEKAEGAWVKIPDSLPSSFFFQEKLF